MWRRIWPIAPLLLLTVLAICTYRGVRWDPRFSAQNLNGLTPHQVVKRVGPPDVDPRADRQHAWTPADEAAGEPLKFFYDRGWAGQEYMIVFKHDHVVSVSRAVK
jgi:hypothetical protein